MTEKRQIPEHLKPLLVKCLGTILLSDGNTLLKTRQLIEVVEEFYDLGFCDGNINGIEVASETMNNEILKAIKPTGMVN